MTGSGSFKSELKEVLTEKDDEKKQFLVHYMGYRQPDQFTMKKNDQENFQVSVNMDIEKVPEFRAGSKMFINPRMYQFNNTTVPSTENRKLDFYFYHPYIESDTTYYILPDGFTVENLPKPRMLAFEYGAFNSNYVFDEKLNRITSTATLILKQNRIPASKFAETKKFYSDVLEEYSDKIVVKQKM